MYIIYTNLLATARAWCALVFTYGGRAAKASQRIIAEQWRASRLAFSQIDIAFDIGRPCRWGTCNVARQNVEVWQRTARRQGKHFAQTSIQKVRKQRRSHTCFTMAAVHPELEGFTSEAWGVL